MTHDPICHIVSPVGCMGYGFDDAPVADELRKLVATGTPVAIILDAGSTDSGPEKLALGTMTCPRSAYVKDLTKLLKLVHKFEVPLIFSSAGGDGSDEHVTLMVKIVREICDQNEYGDYSFKTISIFSGIPKSIVLDRLNADNITPCGACVPALTPEDIESSPRVVAQIGPEPFLDAMKATPGFEILIAGRAYDPAPYVAYSMFQLNKQFPDLSAEESEKRHGGFCHMGKIMECGGLCATPKSHGAVATVYNSGVFDVRPIEPKSRCTPLSVAAHALYENTRPDILRGPGGALYLGDASYEQLEDNRTVRINGAEFHSSSSCGYPYQLKLEAASFLGYRSIAMGSVRDHILINRLDSVLKRVKDYAKEQHAEIQEHWDLDFHVYGKGQSTPLGPGEVFVVAEAIAPTQDEATAVVSTARVGMILTSTHQHGSYPGQKATSGNLAFGIGGKLEIEMGPCASFSIYHLMNLERGEERLESRSKLIRATTAIIGRGHRAPIRGLRPFPASWMKVKPLSEKKDAKPHPEKDAEFLSPANTLSDIATVLRSKNAGPYEITIDVIFESKATFRDVKESKLLSREKIAKALEIAENDIVWMGFFEPALAFKVTIPRVRGGKKAAAGGFIENDIHGSQQHLGLATLPLIEGSSFGSKCCYPEGQAAMSA
ncbi:caib baif family enzyme [Colletotrichum plurivorum]|uniref:Caib baif family enzyme n=1 Tax=Colletotrichum plurivorum TaxID=2175906 RepID=A0A8H6NBF0_9PEZI|nr:caib baif family enzyme [Colletotrichum plurivorum]